MGEEGIEQIRSLDRLASVILRCRMCDTIESQAIPVPGEGSSSAELLLIGEAPGRLGADVTGVPFTRDRTGRFLREVLAHVGLEPPTSYLTNLVKCNPRKAGRNRRPNAKEIENCRRFWKAELQIVCPQIVVPLGRLAAEQVLGLSGLSISMWHGRCISAGSFLVVPFFHPSYVVNRHRYPESAYERDFEWLAALLVSQMPRTWSDRSRLGGLSRLGHKCGPG